MEKKDSKELDTSTWATVIYNGDTYLVNPLYIGPVGIQEAKTIADGYGCELPSPGLVDAIFKQADCRLNALEFVRQHNGTPATMSSLKVLQEQQEHIRNSLGQWILANGPFQLSAGYGKDVVISNGTLGIYGWHRLNGKPIQPFYGKHSTSWKDYSQLLRLVKKI